MIEPDPHRWLTACASGRELVERGHAEDVALAAEVGCSTLVPVLRHGWIERA